MKLYNNLRQIRIDHELNQEELASAVGTYGRTIGRIERGERNASLEMALRLSRYLEVSIEDMFSVNDEFDNK